MTTEFIKLLRSTNRRGIENTISKLQQLGFFQAPASCRFHLNYDGGLVEHSLNVCKVALNLRKTMISMNPSLEKYLPESSVILAALLHDVCKADIYKPAIKRQKNALGYWCDVKGYDIDLTNEPLGHGEKSVIRLLRWGLDLTDDEMLAIRWHMGAWDLPFQSYDLIGNINKAREEHPLVSIIQAADSLSLMLENRI